VEHHRERATVRDGVRSLGRAAEVARVYGVDRAPVQRVGERPGLIATHGVQRDVGMALDPAVAVPVRLTVAGEEERRHVGYGSDVPVLEVTALPQPPDIDLAAVSVALSRSIAGVLEEDPKGTWVVWRTVGAGAYSEAGDAPAVQPRATHPPIVRVTAYEGREQDTIAAVLLAIADTLVERLGLEQGNVMVRWDEVGAGRLYTGGRLVGA
jgi:phenylpyruvate tautomerase PptA (4-oxalocrotonate tautomerase family)